MSNDLKLDGFIANICPKDVVLLQQMHDQSLREHTFQVPMQTFAANEPLAEPIGELNGFILQGPSAELKATLKSMQVWDQVWLLPPVPGKREQVTQYYLASLQMAVYMYRLEHPALRRLLIPACAVKEDGAVAGYQRLIPAWLCFE